MGGFFQHLPIYFPFFAFITDLPSCLALFDLETIFTPKRAVRPFAYDPLDSRVETYSQVPRLHYQLSLILIQIQGLFKILSKFISATLICKVNIFFNDNSMSRLCECSQIDFKFKIKFMEDNGETKYWIFRTWF